MSISNFENRVKKCVADFTVYCFSSLEPQNILEKDLGFDRLTSIELLMSLEEEFEIDIPEESFKSNCHTVKDVIEFLKKIMEIGDNLPNFPLEGVGVLQPENESVSIDFIQATFAFAKQHDLLLMFADEEIIVNFKDNDTEYKVSCLEDLDILIQSSKAMKQFERK